MRREPLLRLREWRERRAFSQSELAERAGLSDAAIIRLEQAQRHAWPRTARVLAEVLGVQPDDLYGSNDA